MRVVVDTNVFVSAALKDTSLPALAVHLVDQRGILLKSIATEQQLFEVLARPYFASLIAPATRDWFKKLLAAAETVTITKPIAACRDPTDDKFLELALNGQADFIVSGDADLLALNPFEDIHRRAGRSVGVDLPTKLFLPPYRREVETDRSSPFRNWSGNCPPNGGNSGWTYPGRKPSRCRSADHGRVSGGVKVAANQPSEGER